MCVCVCVCVFVCVSGGVGGGGGGRLSRFLYAFFFLFRVILWVTVNVISCLCGFRSVYLWMLLSSSCNKDVGSVAGQCYCNV